MTKIHFLTFGNETYYNSLERIKEEALSFNIFDTLFIYKNTDLENLENFWPKHSNFILNNSRGYGYWIWKSNLTLKTLENIDHGDILIYADAGCSLNKNGITRLREYIDIVNNSDHGILSFQLNFPEKQYTKMDIFEYLSMNTEDYLNSKQLVGGIFIMKKTCKTYSLMYELYDIVSNNYSLIDDSPSKTDNDTEFIENRHDQSIFSLLRKKYGTEILDDETYFNDFSSEEAQRCPILAKRLR